MADLWILDKEDNLLAILSSDASNACAFWDDGFREELNQGSTFKFTCDATHPDSKYVAKLNQVVFKDKDGFFRLFKIREIDRENGDNWARKTAQCEPAEMELLEWIIDDVRPYNTTQQDALDRALAGSRWVGNVTASLGINSTNFYHISAYEAITDIINVWGGELKFTVTFDTKSNKVLERVVNILPRRGSDTGAPFEVGYNIQDIHVTEMAYPVSALWGWGGSVEDEDGNNSRFIDFADVVWSKANGDPVDKPKGQKWVEYPPAKEKYGYKKTDGTVINAFGKWQNENIKDPKELLEKTYDQLVNAASQIQTNYALDVELSSDPVELGDTGLALDRTVAEPIEFSGRIIALEYSISDPEGTAKVEMGQFLSVYEPDTRLDQIEDKIDNISRDIIVDDDSFPDIKPPTPTNVEVNGLFAKVQLWWDFEPHSYIAAYEIYGSQVKDFAPDTTNFSNRLWRGKTGGWVHEAEVNQVWYYRIRAVNTRGTASDFTDQYSAATVRIGTNHIEDLSITRTKIGEAAVDTIHVADGAITNAKIDKLSVNKLYGKISEFVQTAWNGINSRISIDSTQILVQATSGDSAKITNLGEFRSDSANGRYAIVGNGRFQAWDNNRNSLFSLGAEQYKGDQGVIAATHAQTFSIGRYNDYSTGSPQYHPYITLEYEKPYNEVTGFVRMNKDVRFANNKGLYMNSNNISGVYGLHSLYGNFISNVSTNGQFKVNAGGKLRLSVNDRDIMNFDSTYGYMYRNLSMEGNSITNQSDVRLKKNIAPTEMNSLACIKDWTFVDFEWINESKPQGKQFGLISQDTPELSIYDQNRDIYYVDSSKQIMMNSQAINQLAFLVDDLQSRIEALEGGDKENE
ncbi:phage tail spike protein [Bacillus haynesii]|uniref:phage tail spike protein n=1 Tax=Bacillus haynesii TaxID=1925021 RepID=UPI002280B2F1|nr:phage tail spike protein [Bacillus haynesii]MCY8408956.1 phage tail protein [Bacillus haynesii]MCY8433495.1 phage tail protein [Bacillus haynesii]MCY8557825.1 phage tail protein [Bacillus haynesii]